MSGGSERQRADELRAKFLANREKVRSWVADWDCPEIAWLEVSAIPLPWVVGEEGEQTWLEHQAPFMDQYQWLLEARPLARGVTHVRGDWRFAEGHEFERLEIHTRTVADPEYLAEILTLGVNAAALKGWTQADTQPVYEWLFEGFDRRPMENMVTGRHRSGFILLDFMRSPAVMVRAGAVVRPSRTEINVRLRLTLTTTDLGGSPLDSNGEPIPR